MDLSIFKHILFWLIVPPFITEIIVSIIHSMFYTRDRKPESGSKRYQTNYKFVYSAVVISYLSYNLYEIERNLSPSYYSIMDVQPNNFSMKALKSNYRSLSLTYHPDKISRMDNVDPKIKENAEEIYMKIRKAYDTLKDPLTEKIYDKFGSGATSCTYCKTAKDYIMMNIWGSVSFYSVSFSLILMGTFMKRVEYGNYWRYVILFGIAALEGALIFYDKESWSANTSSLNMEQEEDAESINDYLDLTSSSGASFLTGDIIPFFVPWRARFERITILHQFYIVLFIAISQIGPNLFPEKDRESDEKKVMKQHIDELDHLTDLLWNDSMKCYESLLKPIKGQNSKYVSLLQEKMDRLAAEYQLYETYPELKEKYDDILKKNLKDNN